jgi:GntR family transcriptional regulator, arabinose operon transcriptional repressor
MSFSKATVQLPKYQQIVEAVKNEILSGRYQPGQKLPSEAALVKRFGASRITVGRALRELRQAGLIQSKVGSGSYVGPAAPGDEGLLFGLLIPNLGDTEIFGPICQGMSQAPQARRNALLWGNIAPEPETKEEQTWDLCQQYISKKVDGVFFAPLERTATNDQTNHRVIAGLERANIPVVLLDRCILPYPKRSRHDLVGIDHRRAGYMITEHLLQLGCRRIAFIGYPNSAATVTARIGGYRDALFIAGIPVSRDLVRILDSDQLNDIQTMMERLKPDGIVCANDRTAGHLMHGLIQLNYRIPQDVRIVGIDDVEYASLLPVPLTTVHQPCKEIGVAAVAAMVERVASPEMPIRDILLDCNLVVRDSCGMNLEGKTENRSRSEDTEGKKDTEDFGVKRRNDRA